MPAGKTILETIIKPEFKKIGDISVFDPIFLPIFPQPKYLTKTPTIWNAEPGDALKNWTSTPSLVRREYW
ncbi:hypothetical protein H5410_060592 [Solanum commersonii]|uniref:Uncharacterized protein n=1 Tax=Solanum commersonii TaxID=4109 RepID=A0A9J5W5M8_SOLCO|nr:hypothetical protein H5410_060592 [Solanum commersonii]